MLWIIFSFLVAFFDSLKSVYGKKSVKTIDEYSVSWSLRFFALIFLLPLLFFIKIPDLNDRFWIALFWGGSLNAIATVLSIKAVKHSDLSIVSPIAALSPLFLLITSPIMLGEFPTFPGLVGVVFIIIGSYVLNIKEKKNGFLAPFRALYGEKGPRLMLIVAFIWSITSNIDKIGVQNSSSIFWVIAINAFIAVTMLPIMLYKPKSFRNVATSLRVLIPMSLFSVLALIFQMIAINLTLVTYVISIKRTSAIMSVLLGKIIFKEKNIRERLLGVVIMIIGVIFITFS